MARLPDASALGERPIPQAGGRITSYRGDSGGETAAGAGLIGGGQNLEAAGSEVYKAYKIEEERNDKIAVEDAFNKFRQRQLDLTIGEKEGFVHKKGTAAVDGKLFDEYTGKLFDVEQEMAGKLSNDRQRRLFKERAGMAGLQYKENLLRHITQESDANAKQVTDGGLAIELKSAALAWRDPAAIGTSLARSAGLLKQQGEREGWAPDMLAAKLLEQQTKIHASVINNALANGNSGYAQQWYKANKAQIVDPNGTIQKSLEEGTTRDESRRLADKIFAKSQTEAQALAEAKNIKDTKVYDATRTRLKNMFADKENEAAQVRDVTFTEASKIVEKTGSTDGIAPDKWVSVLTQDQRRALEKRAEEIRTNKEPVLDEKKFAEFLAIPANKLGAMNQSDVEAAYISHFDRQRRLEAMERWATARKAATGDPTASAKHASTLQFDDIVDGYAREMEILPKGKSKDKLTPEQAAAYNNFRFAADAAIKDYERTKLMGKRAADSEEMKKIVSQTLMQKVFVEKSFLGIDNLRSDPEKLITTLTEDERGKAYVPMSSIPSHSVLAIKKQAAALKVNASERQIERAYAAAKMGASDAAINAILTGAK